MLGAVPCSDDDCLLLLDAADGVEQGRVGVGDHPVHLAVANGRTFVATMGDRAVSVIADGEVSRVETGVLGPSHFATTDAGDVLVPCTGGDALAIIDTARLELRARVGVDDEGCVDNSAVVFDQSLLDLAAPVAATSVGFDRPDVVLTAATDGITLGAAMASEFDATLAYAKKSKETAVEEFIESRQRLASGIELTYYLPAAALSAGDSVLIVDDLIRSGETQELLLDIATQAAADVVGVFTLIAVGDDGLARARQATDAPVDALVTFE